MNNCQKSKNDIYFNHIMKLNAIQVNRNYPEVFYHWDKLVSIDGWIDFIDLMCNITKYY